MAIIDAPVIIDARVIIDAPVTKDEAFIEALPGLEQSAAESRQSTGEESSLMRSVGSAIAAATVPTTLTGFILVSVTDSGLGVVQRLGVGLFVCFWASPFFGIASGIGLHQLKEARRVGSG